VSFPSGKYFNNIKYFVLLYWHCKHVRVLGSLTVSGGFVTVHFYGDGSVAPSPNPNLKGQGLYFVWSLPFDLSGMGDPTRSLRSRQHSSSGHLDLETSSQRYGGRPRGGGTWNTNYKSSTPPCRIITQPLFGNWFTYHDTYIGREHVYSTCVGDPPRANIHTLYFINTVCTYV
jgi:hypothetical protein